MVVSSFYENLILRRPRLREANYNAVAISYKGKINGAQDNHHRGDGRG